MCITEYDEQAVMEGLRKEAYDEGISRGKEETLISMYKKGFITLEVVAEELGMTDDEVLEKFKGVNNI